MSSFKIRASMPVVASGLIAVALVGASVMIAIGSLSCKPTPTSSGPSDSKPEILSYLKPYQLVNNTDLRVLARPIYPPICYIQVTGTNGYSGMGTGFLVSNNVIMTAAHVIDPFTNGTTITSIAVYPSCNGVLLGVDNPPSTNWNPSPGWVSSNGTEEWNDYATVTLTKPYNSITPLKLQTFDPANDTVATLVGYIDKIDSPKPAGYQSLCQFTETGMIIGNEQLKYIYYAIDSSQGDSGSPVFLAGTLNVIGLHVQSGGTLNGQKYNTGLWFNTKMIDFVEDAVKKNLAP